MKTLGRPRKYPDPPDADYSTWDPAAPAIPPHMLEGPTRCLVCGAAVTDPDGATFRPLAWLNEMKRKQDPPNVAPYGYLTCRSCEAAGAPYSEAARAAMRRLTEEIYALGIEKKKAEQLARHAKSAREYYQRNKEAFALRSKAYQARKKAARAAGSMA